MKILMVLDREFPPDIRVENEIAALQQGGHEIHIACYTQKNKPALEKTEQVSIHRKPISKFIYKSSIAILTLPFYNHFWKKYLREILKTQTFDAIHIHDLPLAGVGVLMKKEFGLILTIDLHENWPAFVEMSKHTNTLLGKFFSPVFMWRKFEKRVLKKTDNIIVVVEEARDRLINLGISASKIRIVSNTINLSDLFIKSHGKKEKNILYYAGGINYHRGLQNVILAMHQSTNKKLMFWILGEGSYKNELIALVEQFSLASQVFFFGYQPFQVVMEKLAEADFAVIPHIKNAHTDSTIPHKLFQYMYAKKPVIASDCLPIKRILEETGSGIVYEHNNTKQLAEILSDIHHYDCEKIGAKGEKAVKEKYNWTVDSSVLLNLYNK
ncbi:MAG: glycosyltransferase family 4 protein [Bacteroidales bacterium]